MDISMWGMRDDRRPNQCSFTRPQGHALGERTRELEKGMLTSLTSVALDDRLLQEACFVEHRV